MAYRILAVNTQQLQHHRAKKITRRRDLNCPRRQPWSSSCFGLGRVVSERYGCLFLVSVSGYWPVFSFPVRVLCRTRLRDGRTCQLRDRESYTDLRDRVWSCLARSLHTFFCKPVDSAVPTTSQNFSSGRRQSVCSRHVMWLWWHTEGKNRAECIYVCTKLTLWCPTWRKAKYLHPASSTRV
jgi:hypothetical protein